MPEKRVFLIEFDELMTLVQTKDPMEKARILTAVIARQHKEQSGVAMVAGGLVKGVKFGVAALDKMTGPEKKK